MTEKTRNGYLNEELKKCYYEKAKKSEKLEFLEKLCKKQEKEIAQLKKEIVHSEKAPALKERIERLKAKMTEKEVVHMRVLERFAETREENNQLRNEIFICGKVIKELRKML